MGSGCSVQSWGVFCGFGVQHAELKFILQSWGALAELRCSVQSRALGAVRTAFGKPPGLGPRAQLPRQTGYRSRATAGTMARGGSVSRPFRGRRACLGPLSTPFPAKQREQMPGVSRPAQHRGPGSRQSLGTPPHRQEAGARRGRGRAPGRASRAGGLGALTHPPPAPGAPLGSGACGPCAWGGQPGQGPTFQTRSPFSTRLECSVPWPWRAEATGQAWTLAFVTRADA